MKRFHGRFLVNKPMPKVSLKYMVVSGVESFDKKYNCIVSKVLNIDYYLLFNHIDLIITERGSALSHLSIVALEYGMPIILVEDIMLDIANEGVLLLENNIITYDPYG